ncbi:hemolysin family protein [Nostocoides veronense]|uniref:Hemolysin family protein n=1 Tax=Nostocoides veronense TaxID=330836 RepID=A0ABN2LXU2_9MICO
MVPWLLLLGAIALTAGTALFVATEFSLVALDRPTVQRAVEQGDRKAETVLASLRGLSTQLSAAQVGITLTTLVLGFIAEPSIATLIRPGIDALGVPTSAGGSVSSAVALVIATLFSMIFGELVPQFLGISAPLRVGKKVAGPTRIFAVAAKPLIAVLNGSANAFLRLVGVEPQEELSAARTPQELASLVGRSVAAGTLDEGTGRLVTASLRFGEQTAADVMTPRGRANSIERTASAAEVVALARDTGHSRFPVTALDWDDIDGVVHVKSAIAVPRERRGSVPVSALMVDPVVVPETLRLDPLLDQLRASGLQFAVVVDEYGGTSGVVTLEDVVEEIVGDVGDEHDRSETTGRRAIDGTWIVPGLWRPDEVRSRVGAPMPDGPAYETVGGFVMAALGRVPQVGERVDLPGWQIVVVDMDGRRVDRLRMVPLPPEGADNSLRPDEGEQV